MSNQAFGWTGKHIRVNLSNSKIQVVENDPAIMTSFIGARGLGIKYMTDEVDPRTDALEPNNKFIVATGPLTCMPPGGNRTYFVTKSPLKIGRAHV